MYIDLLNSIDKEFDLIVCLQPDHPDREHTFDYCVDYMINNNYDGSIVIKSS